MQNEPSNQAPIMDQLRQVGVELEPELSEKISDVLTTLVRIIIDLREKGIDLKFEEELGEKFAAAIAVMNKIVSELRMQVDELDKVETIRSRLITLALAMNQVITDMSKSYNKIKRVAAEKETIAKFHDTALSTALDLLAKIGEKYPKQLKDCLTDLKLTPEQFGKLILREPLTE